MVKINVLETEITYFHYEENDFISPEFEGIKSHARLNRLMKNQKNLKSQIVTSSWGGRSDETFKVTNCDVQ